MVPKYQIFKRARIESFIIISDFISVSIDKLRKFLQRQMQKANSTLVNFQNVFNMPL